ncbi:MAG TPA: RAD55 family ATPase [Methanomassiliicoccales archaeon]|nr:RAD55 family ATPase [Methanomassiliicoccales archaeon]
MFKTNFPQMCSVLILGSPGVGMLEFQLGMVKEYLEAEEPVVFVTLDLPPRDLLAVMEAFGIPMDRLGRGLYIIDYHSSLIGNSEEREAYEGSKVRRIHDLEGIMFNVANIHSEVKRPLRVFMNTLSTLFLYNQPSVVLKFFQISTSRIRSEFGTVFVSVFDGVHEEKAVNHLMALADGALELRFDPELNRMMRVRHMRGMTVPCRWIPFEITPAEEDTPTHVLQWK